MIARTVIRLVKRCAAPMTETKSVHRSSLKFHDCVRQLSSAHMCDKYKTKTKLKRNCLWLVCEPLLVFSFIARTCIGAGFCLTAWLYVLRVTTTRVCNLLTTELHTRDGRMDGQTDWRIHVRTDWRRAVSHAAAGGRLWTVTDKHRRCIAHRPATT